MFNRAVASIALALATSTAMAGGAAPIDTVRVASGLTRPIFVTHAPGDYTRAYIIEKQGRIRVLNIKTGALQSVANAFLNIDAIVGGGTSTSDERGLLGLAFHPNFETNGYFYVNYTDTSGNDTRIARYTATNSDSANVSSSVIIWEYNQPFSNHNGGWLGFGPNDGYLYISTGDGGAANDPSNRAQDTTNEPLGKMLRIDVDNGTPYGIPPSNPFTAKGDTRDDEIWAYGLRNPWRCSFDRGTASGAGKGDLYIADVGQNAWEELNYQPASSTGGENYGWRCREGAHNFNFTGTCSAQTFVEPFQEYSHPTGFSITGGYVYRGCAIPTLDGTYFYADYSTEFIWSVDAGGVATNFVNRTSELVPDAGGSIDNIASFGEDLKGEMYICDQSGGEIFKIIPKIETISPADTNCDGVVDALDYLKLIGQWGACDGCVTDLDGNGVVDALDFLQLIGEWG